MNEQILNKINKLLNMADRGTPNEQKIAAMKAQALMLEYRIEIADIFDVDVEKVITVHCNKSVNAYVRWIDNLIQIICENFRCIALYSRPEKTKGKYTQISICGLENDAEICKSVLEYVVKIAQLECKRVINQMRYQGISTKNYKNTFMKGFNEGIKEGFYQQILQNNLYAVAVVVPEEVNDYVAKLVLIDLPFNSFECISDIEVHNAGYQKGIEFVYDMNHAKKLEHKKQLKGAKLYEKQ